MVFAWLAVTVAVYGVAHWLYGRAGRHPLANPVALSVAALIVLLLATGTGYDTYFAGAWPLHFLLGPATVALAVPLYVHLGRIRRALVPLLAGLVAGSLTAIVSATGIAWLLGASPGTVLSLAPKSVTTPIAIGIAESIGGIPSLAAALVIVTGVVGAMTAGPLLDLLGIGDRRARGFAIGVAAHGIGTARAFQEDPLTGTFSGLAMGLNGLLTAVLAPLLLGLARHAW